MNTEVQKAAGAEVRFFMPNTESLASLENLEPKFSLNIKYKTSDDWAQLKDKPYRCFYMGTKEIPNEDGEVVLCGQFVSQTEVFISGQTTLMEAVKRLDIQTPIEITYKGRKQNKTTEGTTMLFEVKKLG